MGGGGTCPTVVEARLAQGALKGEPTVGRTGEEGGEGRKAINVRTLLRGSERKRSREFQPERKKELRWAAKKAPCGRRGGKTRR